MEYRLLGSSGCAVSALALGTLTFGNETDEAGSFAQLDRVHRGRRDPGGHRRRVRGRPVRGDHRALAGRPGRAAASRSCWPPRAGSPTDETPNGHGLSRQHLALALDASLRRLNVETIDLYQVHGWDPLTRIGETLRFLDDAVRAGKINYVGLSNFTGWQVQKAVDLADAPRAVAPGVPAAAVQPAGPRGRVGDRARLPGRRAGPARLVPAGQRLADRQVPARRAARPGHPGGRERRRGNADLEPARRLRADLAGPRRGPQGRRGPRRVHGPGGDRLGAGPARGLLGDPRRPHRWSSSPTTWPPQACS